MSLSLYVRTICPSAFSSAFNLFPANIELSWEILPILPPLTQVYTIRIAIARPPTLSLSTPCRKVASVCRPSGRRISNCLFARRSDGQSTDRKGRARQKERAKFRVGRIRSVQYVNRAYRFCSSGRTDRRWIYNVSLDRKIASTSLWVYRCLYWRVR